ncbi:4'-phosphopantetheinyl transferase family protein [Salinispora arenicola]|uniref:4'-phosphopantetheinyl transferase family protein n=1 Tax=Salinispora arenicola TaxID=168697 RepID=UPI0016AC02AA|nr:4'-phosphopantetheinyl transferase superfamily protein [Salinispora arenicola]NIL58638.1 4'-phosphopantetheinyl transferase superfamily protein [Salinispora arenicola]NIL63831.1 4'-phosphopantetheinyl transferase superfamily protein [Salinispora arenicola]
MRVQVSPGVWVAQAWQPPPSAHPTDRRAMASQPAWRRAERLAARGLLRQLLSEIAPESAQARLVPTRNGKPMLAGWPTVGVSISHDGSAVAAAVAVDGQVGVDVQLPIHRPSDRIARRCLRERAPELDDLPPDQRALELAWVWSVQEACVKADGTGIAGRPWAIDVPVRPHTGRWGRLRWIALRDNCTVPVSCAYGGARC